MLPWMTDQFSPWVPLRKCPNYTMLMQRRKRIDWHRNRRLFPDYFPPHFQTHMTPPYVSSSSSVNYSIFCGTGENQLENSYVGIWSFPLRIININQTIHCKIIIFNWYCITPSNSQPSYRSLNNAPIGQRYCPSGDKRQTDGEGAWETEKWCRFQSHSESYLLKNKLLYSGGFVLL